MKQICIKCYLHSFWVVHIVSGTANPGGGGVRARGGDLTMKSIFLVGGLIEYRCTGVGTFALFVFSLLWEWCICRSYMFSDNAKSSCLLKSSLRNSSLKSRV